MSPRSLYVSLFLSQCVSLAVCVAVTERVLDVKSVVGADCTLPCTAELEPGVQYVAVRWYKGRATPVPHLVGLLSKDLPNGTAQQYTSEGREAALVAESHNILLPNVTCSDSGLYTCRLAAPVGEQNQEGQVLLTLTGCTESPGRRQMMDAYMVIIATAVLMVALVTFLISHVCLKNTLRDRHKATTNQTSLDAPLKPLQNEDLMLIYTLGPKPTTKHVCV